jgi:hypothetical protein
MGINDAIALAERIDSLIRRADMFGKSREDVLEELYFFSEDLKDYADRLDASYELAREREDA